MMNNWEDSVLQSLLKIEGHASTTYVETQKIGDNLIALNTLVSEVAPWVVVVALGIGMVLGAMLWQIMVYAKDRGKVW